MPNMQIKPFGVFTGSKTASQSTNNANTSFGCIGCVPQQPASVSTPSPVQGFGGAAMIRPL